MSATVLPRKKTKIVATIGPQTESASVLEQLILAGMNVARLNMSHGDHEEHRKRIQTIREVSKKLDTPIAILLDLSGPKIRTGTYVTDIISILAGEELTLTTQEVVGDVQRISINYSQLPQEVSAGSIIMLDDGKKKLEVQSVEGTEIHCVVRVGGELKPHRGVNVPGAYLSIPTVTKKDEEDLRFGMVEGVDMFALSFVRRAKDISDLKKLMTDAYGLEMPIIAKIETQESIDNLEDILIASDGAMVARGDLAIEIPAEQVPLCQKDIIMRCRALGKPVITATQMLDSMIKSPVPTRAEVSDIANAVFDGTDAVMLSEETALGQYPVEAVSMMSRIAITVEENLSQFEKEEQHTITDAISISVCKMAHDINAKLIVALTETGTTAQLIARFSPDCPIIALTPHEKTVRKLTLVAGVYPYQIAPIGSLEEGMRLIPTFLEEKQLGQKGDTVIITAGMHFGISGSTDMLCALQL